MEGIEISQGKVGTRRDIALLNVKGYVDTMTCSTLLNQITDNLNAGILHVIVDMAQVNYVSSAGWGVFVGEIKGIQSRDFVDFLGAVVGVVDLDLDAGILEELGDAQRWTLGEHFDVLGI